ncbi:MAG TPA: DUF222 domain-containing protein [Longimicrobiales bacterium]|nr:DUF222 domain-containing protein [Longimicrobiales bacterium]
MATPAHALPVSWAASEPPPLHVVRDLASATDPASAADPASAPRPPSATEVDPDLLEELGDEIRTLAAHIHAANHHLLTLIARFDALRGWEPGGFRSCAHWLSYNTGIDLGSAREHVRVAHALEELPETSASMARGELSFSKVRALTRVAEPESEPVLLELARGCSTELLEREVRAWRKGSRQDEAARERERHRSRSLTIFPDDDGMYVIRGRLTPEVAAVLKSAIHAASDVLYREDASPAADTVAEAKRLHADAIGLIAERALGLGFGRGRGSGAANTSEEDTAEPPISGTSAARYVALLLVDEAALRRDEEQDIEVPAAPGEDVAIPERVAQNEISAAIRSWDSDEGTVVSGEARSTLNPSRAGEPGGSTDAAATIDSLRGPRRELRDGTRLSHETARRLTCDCGIARMKRAPDGSLLDLGRKTRTITPALRRALEVRDRGCRFPGCGLPFTAGHHIQHWADGGPTSLANCVLLCRFHHRLVHEGGWKVAWWGEGRPVFIDPRGGEHFDATWRAPRLGDHPVERLMEHNRAAGAMPDAMTASGRWQREDDIPTRVLLEAFGGSP